MLPLSTFLKHFSIITFFDFNVTLFKLYIFAATILCILNNYIIFIILFLYKKKIVINVDYLYIC